MKIDYVANANPSVNQNNAPAMPKPKLPPSVPKIKSNAPLRLNNNNNMNNNNGYGLNLGLHNNSLRNNNNNRLNNQRSTMVRANNAAF